MTNDDAQLNEWESRWSPYDEATYEAALNYISPDDIVLDIGAGDLRFARRAAQIARQVYAIELQPALLANQADLPANLNVLRGDARSIFWPPGITVGVLLMRHCTHLSLYTSRLRRLGCQRLITNARWGMAVEQMTLSHRADWQSFELGWYACLCGRVGFRSGPPEKLTLVHTWQVIEVETCPDCSVVH